MNRLIIEVDVFGVAAIVVGFAVVCYLMLTEDRRGGWEPGEIPAKFAADVQLPVDDADEYLGPLRSGGRSAERQMRRHLREIGFMPLKRTSEATRRLVVAVEKHRPRGSSWGRHRRPLEPLPAEPTVLPAAVPPAPVPVPVPQMDYEIGDNTDWAFMRTELFAMLEQDGAS